MVLLKFQVVIAKFLNPSKSKAYQNVENIHTLQGTNISNLGKREIIFKTALVGDMLVPRRVSMSTTSHFCSKVLACLCLLDSSHQHLPKGSGSCRLLWSFAFCPSDVSSWWKISWNISVFCLYKMILKWFFVCGSKFYSSPQRHQIQQNWWKKTRYSHLPSVGSASQLHFKSWISNWILYRYRRPKSHISKNFQTWSWITYGGSAWPTL